MFPHVLNEWKFLGRARRTRRSSPHSSVDSWCSRHRRPGQESRRIAESLRCQSKRLVNRGWSETLDSRFVKYFAKGWENGEHFRGNPSFSGCSTVRIRPSVRRNWSTLVSLLIRSSINKNPMRWWKFQKHRNACCAIHRAATVTKSGHEKNVCGEISTGTRYSIPIFIPDP